MKNYTLKPLGNDNAFGSFNTSYYFDDKTSNSLFIFDCGYSVFNQVKLYLDINSYENFYICISHLHSDHIGSLSTLIDYIYSLGKKPYIISKCKNIKDVLSFMGVPDSRYVLKQDFIDDNISINLLKTSHSPILDAYSFLLDIEGKKIIYTADTNTLEPYIPYFDQILEFYVDTCSVENPYHLHIENSYRYLKMLNDRGCLVKLIHLDNKESLSRYIDEFEN